MSALARWFAPWADFPSLHPLVVHFSVVLIPVGTLFLVLGLSFRQRALEWSAVFCLGIGWLSGLLASTVLHPHVDALTLLARETLDAHEFWADLVLWLSPPAVVLAVIQIWMRPIRSRAVLAGLALLLSVGASVAVLAAGHHGASLTHIHRVSGE